MLASSLSWFCANRALKISSIPSLNHALNVIALLAWGVAKEYILKAAIHVASLILVCARASLSLAESDVSASCNDVLRFSAETTVRVLTKNEIKKHAQNFCKEFSSKTDAQSRESLGLEYDDLFFNSDGSRSSSAQVNSRFCGSDSALNAEQYYSTNYERKINPAAFNSFNACVELLNKGVRISGNNIMLAKEFSLSASYSTNEKTAKAKLRVASSSDVECKWDGFWNYFGSAEKELKNGSTATLTCKRKQTKFPSSVSVINANSSSDKGMTILWSRYDSLGYSIDELKALEQRINKQLKLAVVAFNDSVCPDGWGEYVPAQGRFVRGIDKSGSTVNDPQGKRAPGNIQTDELGSHTHSVTWTHGEYFRGHSGMGVQSDEGDQIVRNDLNIVIEKTGGPETRPKNVSLLYCIKL